MSFAKQTWEHGLQTTFENWHVCAFHRKPFLACTAHSFKNKSEKGRFHFFKCTAGYVILEMANGFNLFKWPSKASRVFLHVSSWWSFFYTFLWTRSKYLRSWEMSAFFVLACCSLLCRPTAWFSARIMAELKLFHANFLMNRLLKISPSWWSYFRNFQIVLLSSFFTTYEWDWDVWSSHVNWREGAQDIENGLKSSRLF